MFFEGFCGIMWSRVRKYPGNSKILQKCFKSTKLKSRFLCENLIFFIRFFFFWRPDLLLNRLFPGSCYNPVISWYPLWSNLKRTWSAENILKSELKNVQILLFYKSMIIGGIKKLSDDKNSPEMNDSEVDPAARKNPDEKY